MSEGTISKEEFRAYEEVRKSGVTNMCDTAEVSKISGLSKEKVMAIILHYHELSEMFPEVVE